VAVIPISVIIPTFNRAEVLAGCLDALAGQTAPPDSFEVVVVDDGSSDRTGDVISSFDPPFRLRAARQPNAGQAAALNHGIRLAEGRFCLFLDDDVVAEPALVAEHRSAQERHGGIAGLGMLTLRMLGRPGGLARHFADWWQDHYERLANGALVPDFRACYSGNLSVPADVLQRVGGFDATLPRSFDVELAYRLEQAGVRIVFLPGAVAEQQYSKGFRAIVRDFDRMGEAAVPLYRRHRDFIRYPPLGDFGHGTFRTLLLRKALLALRVPVWPLGVVDRLFASRPPRRLYGLLQLHCFWRSVRKALADREEWRRLTRGSVVLMYHALGPRGERASRYVLPAARFRRQLRWLRLRRYPIISLDDYVKSREQGVLPPGRAVVLTLDDGYADNAELGSPLLQAADAPATVFVVSDAIGRTNEWSPGTALEHRRLLTSPQLKELRARGTAIGAHTLSHPNLVDLDPAEARREIADSRVALGAELDSPVLHFAYPFGKSSAEVRQLVQEAGFASACGIQPGPNGAAVPLHDVRRVEVDGTWSLLTFALSVWTGYPPRFGRGR
jgi:GT2 family glycosyltransferase/peptidoglycan/xylan/chitin deacetylase (PgdA/CDA1 family)